MKRYHVFGVSVGLVVAMVAVLGLSTTLIAQEPGDVGSRECRLVQLEAQDTVDADGPYKNHGQMVRTAANVVSPYDESGDITEECASCIMNQFARRIQIGDQEACGPDIPTCADPGVCGDFTNCVEDGCPRPEGAPEWDNGICFTLYDDSGVCLHDYWCADVTECVNGPSDCAVGEVCVVDSCCVVNTCVPPAYFCWPQ